MLLTKDDLYYFNVQLNLSQILSKLWVTGTDDLFPLKRIHENCTRIHTPAGLFCVSSQGV